MCLWKCLGYRPRPDDRQCRVLACSCLCCVRRKLSAIIVALACVLVLMPDTVHLPALVGHYLDHKEREPGIGVVDFLVLHYMDAEHTANGDGKHEQLPFRHRHPAGDNLPIMVLALGMPVVAAPSGSPPVYIDHGGDRPLAGHGHGLIQPPRC